MRSRADDIVGQCSEVPPQQGSAGLGRVSSPLICARQPETEFDVESHGANHPRTWQVNREMGLAWRRIWSGCNPASGVVHRVGRRNPCEEANNLGVIESGHRSRNVAFIQGPQHQAVGLDQFCLPRISTALIRPGNAGHGKGPAPAQLTAERPCAAPSAESIFAQSPANSLTGTRTGSVSRAPGASGIFRSTAPPKRPLFRADQQGPHRSHEDQNLQIERHMLDVIEVVGQLVLGLVRCRRS